MDLTEVERVRALTTGGTKPVLHGVRRQGRRPGIARFPLREPARVPAALASLLGDRACRGFFTATSLSPASANPGAESIAFLDILRDADRLSLTEITEALHDLAVCDPSTNRQWREFTTLIRRLPSCLSTLLIRLPCLVPSLWGKYRGGAVLVSSPPSMASTCVAGTWTHPLGVSFGFVKRRPVVRGEAIVACPTFTLTLSFDRRVMAGAQAARFFRRIVELLEKAEPARDGQNRMSLG